MAEPITEPSNDIRTATAIAQTQANAATDVNDAHIRAQFGVGNAEVAEILAAAQTRAFAVQATASMRAEGETFLGALDANMARALANIAGSGDIAAANGRLATIAGNAATQADATTLETKAQVESLAGQAAIGSDTAAALATIDADESTQVAASHADQSAASAQAQADATRAEASIRAAATLEVARTQGSAAEATIRAQGARDEASIEAGGVTAAASIQVATLLALAGIDAAGDADEVAVRYESLLDLAYTRAGATRNISAARVAESDASTAAEVAELARVAAIRAAADTRGADVRHDSGVYAAGQDALGVRDVADSQSTASGYRASQGLLGTQDGADRQYQSTAYTSDRERQGRRATATSSAEANGYADDQQYAAIVAHEQSETARLLRKLAYADAKFAVIWPYASSATPGAPAAVPGFPVPSPFVSARWVYSPAAMQRRVNQAFAAGDATSQAALRTAQGDVAGRGFGGSTPALEALRLGIFGRSIADTGRALTRARFESMEANAAELLKAQVTRSDRFMLDQKAAVEAERNRVGRQVGVLAAAAALTGA